MTYHKKTVFEIIAIPEFTLEAPEKLVSRGGEGDDGDLGTGVAAVAGQTVAPGAVHVHLGFGLQSPPGWSAGEAVSKFIGTAQHKKIIY